jgi:hypothetical protein
MLEAGKNDWGGAGVRERGDVRFDTGFGLDEAVGGVVPVSRECECFGGFFFESA